MCITCKLNLITCNYIIWKKKICDYNSSKDVACDDIIYAHTLYTNKLIVLSRYGETCVYIRQV